MDAKRKPPRSIAIHVLMAFYGHERGARMTLGAWKPDPRQRARRLEAVPQPRPTRRGRQRGRSSHICRRRHRHTAYAAPARPTRDHAATPALTGPARGPTFSINRLERFRESDIPRHVRTSLELIALRHQVFVFRRQRPHRLRLFLIDRLFWVALPTTASTPRYLGTR
jgi:hypothetical protein